jgi:hypothetical protein
VRATIGVAPLRWEISGIETRLERGSVLNGAALLGERQNSKIYAAIP